MSQVLPRMAPWEAKGTRVSFNQNTAATHEVVAAPGAGFKIRILNWSLVLVAANTVTWKSASTSISSAFPFQSGGLWEPRNPWQQYECAENEALQLTLGSAQQVQGDIFYEIIKA